MVMLGRIGNPELQRHFVQEGWIRERHAKFGEVLGHVEDQLITSGTHVLARQQRLVVAAIRVGVDRLDCPVVVAFEDREVNSYPAAGLPFTVSSMCVVRPADEAGCAIALGTAANAATAGAAANRDRRLGRCVLMNISSGSAHLSRKLAAGRSRPAFSRGLGRMVSWQRPADMSRDLPRHRAAAAIGRGVENKR